MCYLLLYACGYVNYLMAEKLRIEMLFINSLLSF